jgi:acetyl esterase/lipase
MASNQFDPELRTLARLAPREPIRASTLWLTRRLTGLFSLQTPRDVEVLTLQSGVGVRLYRPGAVYEPNPALLWMHGGGYVMGSAGLEDALCRSFVRELGITVASVEYRLAPEHPYPAALDDCDAALTWLAALPAVDPNRIAIGGGSAGGGLAAALAFRARDSGSVVPVLQLLTYPMLDDRTVNRPGLEHAGLRLWNQRSNRFGWDSYLGGADPDTAVPARRGELAGLPAAWVGVGSLDLFHNEDLDYAERLSKAGVPCHVEVAPGAFHAFDLVAAKSDVARSFFASQCASLRGHHHQHQRHQHTRSLNP